MANCRVCKHNYKPSTCEPKCARMCDGETDFEPITNGDKIRKMSDEELAGFLCGVFDDDDCDGKYICGITIPHYDEEKIADWLKSPTTD